MARIARQIRDSGVRAVGIASVFSPLNPACEEQAAVIIREECPEVAITLSHDLGRLGLLERENVTLLNAALIDLARRTTRAYLHALEGSGVRAPLYLTQNDGTITRAEIAAERPVYGFASGPTNSMRGAAFLSRIADAIVVDVGGTTSDIGALRHGFPREANNVVEVGGVRTNFRMPDVMSIGLGGGTIVRPGEPLRVGPDSVGYEITRRALIFGGDALTCSDVAAAAGLIDLGDPGRIRDLDRALVSDCLAAIHRMIEESVDRMKPDASLLPLIAVGGGSFLIPERIAGISEVVNVEHQAVANAVGAAIAQVSGEVDQIFRDLSREEAIDRARRQAEERAVKAGADPATLKVVEVEDLPIAYLPGNSLRIRVRVVGDIA
jgi:N-methylhydantoinase A/oxoprolinase/acetone carboxylase beta subunit